MQQLMKSLETRADPAATLPIAKDSEEMQGDAACQSHGAARGSPPHSRPGADEDSGNQRPACTVYSRRAGRRRLKVPDGALPGQRYQWREGALEWDRKVRNR